jgi:hypothetical protein
MAPPADKRFFFIHVMKTGGTSFTEILDLNFDEDERHPNPGVAQSFFEGMESYMHIPKLVSNVNASNGKIRMVSAHVPYAVRSLFNGDYETLTVLREPVDRTISYLKHCRRYHIEHKSLTLEDIYADAWFQASFIQNYQTKIFSMTAEECLSEDRFIDGSPILPPRHEMGDAQDLSAELNAFKEKSPGRFCLEFYAASTGVIKADEKRLAVAKRNLDTINIVGVTEHYDRFVSQLNSRYNWETVPIPHRHLGESDLISPEFRNRIARDNTLDIKLYEYAKSMPI